VDLRNLLNLSIFPTAAFREAIHLIQPPYLSDEVPISTMVMVKGRPSAEYLVDIDVIAVVLQAASGPEESRIP
jgi:hypothetical protein